VAIGQFMDNRSRTKEAPVARYAGPCLFAVASLVLAAFPLVPQLFGSGKGKDYWLWFEVGQWVLQGRELYNEQFRFLYTPFAAVILAGFSYFGRTAMVVLLTIVNIISWWIAIKTSNLLAAENRPLPWWAPVLPSLLAIFFIYGPLSEHEGGSWKHRNRPKSEAPAELGAVRHADAAIVTAEFKLPFETLTQAALKLH